MSSKHGATWWSGRFLRSLERLGMTTRLRRGHAYFEEGRVLDLEVEPGCVNSVVRGTEEYQCRIFFEPFSNMDWNESLERLAFEDLSAAALLTTGRMPPQIEDFFLPSRRRLLPQGEHDLEFHCTCPDRSVPCKHLSATAYKLAEMLDLDPWLLFLLRGRSAAEVEQALTILWDRELNEENEVLGEGSGEREVSAWSDPHNVDLFWSSQLQAPILFPSLDVPSNGLTVDRMSLPEPKIDETAWKEVLREIYQLLADRASENLE